MKDGKHLLIHDGVKAYEAIFDAITARIGLEMCLSITGMARADVDKKDPMASILRLLSPMVKMLGVIPTKKMAKDALQRAFVDAYADELLMEINEAMSQAAKP